MKNFRRILSLGVIALMYVGVAAANQIVSSETIGPTSVSVNTFTLNDFNPALGNLTGATLSLEAIETVTNLVVSNTGNSTETGTLIMTSIETMSNNTANSTDLPGGVNGLTDYDFNSAVENSPTGPVLTLGASGSGTCPVNLPTVSCSSVTFNNGSTNPLSAPLGDDETAVKNVLAGNLADYLGVGTFQITATNAGFTGLSFNGTNISATLNANATLIATITYTYSPYPSTPEPATMFLMGSALVGVGLLRKRIKR